MRPVKPTLYLIRHGQTDWNVEGRLQGQKDIHLNTNGRRQAAGYGEMLMALFAEKDQTEAEFDWVASPLMRARDTMEILRGEMGLDPEAYRRDPVLHELSFGIWEGSTMADLRESDPVGRAARKKGKWQFVPPGGESYQMLSARIEPWLFGLTKDTVCVAHGGITRVVRGMLEGLSTVDIPVLDIPQDRIYLSENGKAGWI